MLLRTDCDTELGSVCFWSLHFFFFFWCIICQEKSGHSVIEYASCF